jgi:hypothetical protein
MITARRYVMFCFVLFLLVTFTSCGYRVSSIMMSNKSYPPKSSSNDIQVFHNLPERPNIIIAKIFAAPRNPGDISTWSSAKVIELLKERARELGADAVVIKDISMAPTGTVGQGGFSGEALAIRWTE